MQIAELACEVNELGGHILSAVRSAANDSDMRAVSGLSDSGDASFNFDVLAEKVVSDWLARKDLPVAVYTEDMGFFSEHESPQYVLVIDPVDGSRAFKAGLETACVSIAAAEFKGKHETCFSDVVLGNLWEVKSDVVFTAQAGAGLTIKKNGSAVRPFPRTVRRLNDMAWAFEVCGRPAKELFFVLGDLINGSAVRGGCFLFNSTTYAIARVVLGRLDALIDVGVRIVEEAPDSVNEMFEAGQKQVLGLFPYDLAAIYLVAREAGIVMTDAYGESLDDRRLLGSDSNTRLSCVVAQSSLLHEQIMGYISARFGELLGRSKA